MTATAPLIIHYSKKYLLKQDIKKTANFMFKLEVPEMTCTTNKKAHGIHRERFSFPVW